MKVVLVRVYRQQELHNHNILLHEYNFLIGPNIITYYKIKSHNNPCSYEKLI